MSIQSLVSHSTIVKYGDNITSNMRMLLFYQENANYYRQFLNNDPCDEYSQRMYNYFVGRMRAEVYKMEEEYYNTQRKLYNQKILIKGFEQVIVLVKYIGPLFP